MPDEKIFPHQEMPYLKERLESPTCVVATAYSGLLVWLESCMASIQKLNLFTILSYDGPSIPPRQISELASITTIIPHSQATLNYYSLVHWKLALPIVEELGFKYVFVLCADNYIEKPEGFPELLKKMEGYDVLTYWQDGNTRIGVGRVGTMAWICTVPAWRAILDRVSAIWYEYPACGKVEEKVSKAIFQLGLKLAPTMEPNEKYDFRLAPDGWNGVEHQNRGIFGRLIGLRHLHRECELRNQQNLKPLEKKFLDLRYQHAFVPNGLREIYKNEK